MTARKSRAPKKIRVLFCTMQYGHGYNQGTEKYVSNLASGLVASGLEVIIAAGDPDQLERRGSNNKSASSDRLITLPTSGWSELYGREVSYYTKLLEGIQPDIIHMANPAHIGVNLLVAARQLQIPYVVTATDFWWLCPKHTLTLKDGSFCQGFRSSEECRTCILDTHPRKSIQRLHQNRALSPLVKGAVTLKNVVRQQSSLSWPDRNLVLQRVLSKAEKIICLSRSGKERIEDFFNLSNASYLPTGLSDHWFSEPQNRDCRPSLCIGYLGALAPHKGLHTLLDSLSDTNLKNIEVKIAGKISDRHYAAQQLDRDLNIDYQGELDELEAVSFIDSVDLIVIPSNSPENQPQVLLEAAARGKRVVASDSPGCAELLHKSVIFPTNDAASLRSILKCFINDPSAFPTPAKPRAVLEITKEMINLYESVFNSINRSLIKD